MWRCRSADVKVRRCRSADVKVGSCRSADVKVWRCRSADVKVWRCNLQMWKCEDVDLQMWRCEGVDLQMWRCEDVGLQMWRCQDVDLQMYYNGCFFTKNPSQARSGKNNFDAWLFENMVPLKYLINHRLFFFQNCHVGSIPRPFMDREIAEKLWNYKLQVMYFCLRENHRCARNLIWRKSQCWSLVRTSLLEGHPR